MDQQRLFRLAVESGQITFNHEPGRGWRLVFGVRRGDESWHDAEIDTYEALTTVELLSVISTCLDLAL